MLTAAIIAFVVGGLCGELLLRTKDYSQTTFIVETIDGAVVTGVLGVMGALIAMWIAASI